MAAEPQNYAHHVANKTGPGKNMGKGEEDIGIGAAKGTAGAVGNLAHADFGGGGESMGEGAG